MSHPKQNLHEFLDQSFARFRTLPSNGVESACERVLDRLKKETDRTPEVIDLRPRSSRRYRRLVVLVAATAAVAVFAQQLVTRRQTPALPVLTPTVVPLPQVSLDPPKPPASTPPQSLRFAAASVKTMKPATMMAGAGLACHGVDGVQRIVLTLTEGGQDAVRAPLGRCVGNGVFLSTLIELAYGVQPHNIRGGPDWARTTGFLTVDVLPETSKLGAISTLPTRGNSEGIGWIADESLQIEAVADNPSTATLGHLRQMLQTMLADRFGLKVHRERRQAAGYSLVVAEGGHKLKPISGEYEESTLPTKGKSTLDKLARTLSSILVEDLTVVDKTGLKDVYEYELHFMPYDPLMERAAFLSRKLEDQLGLRLQAEKSVTIEVLVIDNVNQPTPN